MAICLLSDLVRTARLCYISNLTPIVEFDRIPLTHLYYVYIFSWNPDLIYRYQLLLVLHFWFRLHLLFLMYTYCLCLPCLWFGLSILFSLLFSPDLVGIVFLKHDTLLSSKKSIARGLLLSVFLSFFLLIETIASLQSDSIVVLFSLFFIVIDLLLFDEPVLKVEFLFSCRCYVF